MLLIGAADAGETALDEAFGGRPETLGGAVFGTTALVCTTGAFGSDSGVTVGGSAVVGDATRTPLDDVAGAVVTIGSGSVTAGGLPLRIPK